MLSRWVSAGSDSVVGRTILKYLQGSCKALSRKQKVRICHEVVVRQISSYHFLLMRVYVCVLSLNVGGLAGLC